MRWMTFATEVGGAERVGVLSEDARQVAALPPGTTLLGLLRSGTDLNEVGKAALADRSELHAVGAVHVLAPVPEPPAIRDFMAFEQHVQSAARHRGEEVPEAWFRLPVFYFSNPASIFGSHDPIRIPPGCDRFDFELEVACVIGREACDVAAPDALDYVAGFTIFCDWSARDLQLEEMAVGLGPAKGKDAATTLGPVLVTPDELADVRTDTGYDLAMRAWVNGRLLGEDRWSSVRFSFGEMIERASRGTRLRPGDVLGSGTCGNGCLSELRRSYGTLDWLRGSDVVRLEVERLGVIEALIVA